MKEELGPIVRGVLFAALGLVGLCTVLLGCSITGIFWLLAGHVGMYDVFFRGLVPSALGGLVAAGCFAGIVVLLRSKTKPSYRAGLVVPLGVALL